MQISEQLKKILCLDFTHMITYNNIVFLNDQRYSNHKVSNL